ncbi:MAG: hypothetical protein OXF75_08050 [Acidimicrobiaceae bacterium]|nr:hypothetical protein [Acidimicrobiaceae bacterium]
MAQTHNTRMFMLAITLVTIVYGIAANAWSIDVRYELLLYIPVGLTTYFLVSIKWPIVGSSRQLAKRIQDHWRLLLYPLEERISTIKADEELSSFSTEKTPEIFKVFVSIANLMMLLLVLSIIGTIVSDSTGLSMRIVSLAVFAIVVSAALWTFRRRNRAG